MITFRQRTANIEILNKARDPFIRAFLYDLGKQKLLLPSSNRVNHQVFPSCYIKLILAVHFSENLILYLLVWHSSSYISSVINKCYLFSKLHLGLMQSVKFCVVVVHPTISLIQLHTLLNPSGSNLTCNNILKHFWYIIPLFPQDTQHFLH